MQKFATLDTFKGREKVVLLRLDLNLPCSKGQITDDSRIIRSLPTLNDLLAKRAKILVVSHFGRPKGWDKALSLAPIAKALKNYISAPVSFVDDCVGEKVAEAVRSHDFGSVIVLENLRFYGQEEMNDLDFSKALASQAEVYINDAFSCSHRAHASVVGVVQFLPAYAGRAMEKELEQLQAALDKPQRPLTAIVGGSKVSSKIELLTNLCQKVDHLIIGGGMANTFLAAQGMAMGGSRVEKEHFTTVNRILESTSKSGCQMLLPQDGLATKEIASDAPCRVSSFADLTQDEMIVDVGPQTLERIQVVIQASKTVVWNGPLGVFEVPPFDRGSIGVAKALAEAVVQGSCVIAGGGDTLSALHHAGYEGTLTYASTAGGAFLEWLEGKVLPGVEALVKAANSKAA